jgi:hypothetical protein
MAYGQTNVNSGARGGEFLVGNLNFFQVATVVPCYPTNVKTPLAEALKARNFTSLSGARTITVVTGNGNSVTYSSNAAYTDAYNTQKNLDTLLSVFSTRGNPVLVSVRAAVVADGNGPTVLAGGVNAVDFGSTYNGEQTGYFINLATERNPVWVVDSSTTESNTNGYQLLSALAGVPTLATTTIAATQFVVGGSDNDRNIIATVREEV